MDYLLHFDEIFLKGKNQSFFCRQMMKNLSQSFPRAEIHRLEGGLWLGNISKADEEKLALIPGLANFAQALRTALKLEALEAGFDGLPKPAGIKTFRVSSERANKKFPLSSRELEVFLGNYIRTKTGWQVDLDNYDFDFHVHIGGREALIYSNTVDGAGGLPVGTAGRVLCLLSGGIDSPVAAYELMKRGAEVGLIHFQNETKVSTEVAQKIIDLARQLTPWQPVIDLYVVPFAALQRQIVMKIPSRLRMIVSRRQMFRLAAELAQNKKYLALATGDSLGQVASQTLENMAVIYESTGLLKLTPLVSHNKKDIMTLARRLGTLEISERPYEDCCSLFVARHPDTKSKLGEVKKLEASLDLSTIDKSDIISYHISKN